MKNYKSMRGVSLDLSKLMAKAEKSISVGNTNTNARGDQLGRGGRVIKSADEIAREHYNQNNPRAVVKSSIKVDNVLDAGKPVQQTKQTVSFQVENDLRIAFQILTRFNLNSRSLPFFIFIFKTILSSK